MSLAYTNEYRISKFASWYWKEYSQQLDIIEKYIHKLSKKFYKNEKRKEKLNKSRLEKPRKRIENDVDIYVIVLGLRCRCIYCNIFQRLLCDAPMAVNL